MSDLAGFVLARVGEDEREADYESDDHSPVTNGGIEWTTVGWGDHPVLAIHPARVLAECAAVRAIVSEHHHDDSYTWGNGVQLYRCDTCHRGEADDDGPLHCVTLRLLAQPYADHPEFRDEWRVP